ncbi:MAG: 23S rRNA (pseudouridine(1915)-N(3))-methyltransferase RlmH [Bacillota bacterium]|nr:23S rRNA (pseudouridine(1915)-N(3))-methyltransferase RlmH [Bacillota bacterium]HHU43419.1 23S rRNA (pseudouridine(1915)-N(3))-methyltransferase RlmH [Clostridiales bacterium]
MTINLIAVGSLKEKYWTDAIKEYQKRLSRFCKLNIIETPEARTKEEEIKNIIKKIKGYSILFDIKGKLLSSEEFSAVFSKKLLEGISCFSLIIGGSEGVDESLKKQVDLIVSFGKVTYPHQLMRVILIEQIYRAITIINNITYHK